MRTISYVAALAALAGSVVATPPVSGTDASSATAEQAFLRDNEDAMSRMMVGMTPRPTGDVDRDFAGMMIPHHQGAIDMALAELKYGRNDRLRRIAQEIIVDQQQEIAAMRLALDQPALDRDQAAPSAVNAPDGRSAGGSASDHSATMHMEHAR